MTTDNPIVDIPVNPIIETPPAPVEETPAIPETPVVVTPPAPEPPDPASLVWIAYLDARTAAYGMFGKGVAEYEHTHTPATQG